MAAVLYLTALNLIMPYHKQHNQEASNPVKPALALLPSRSIVLPFLFIHLSMLCFDEAQDIFYGGIMVVVWFHGIMAQVMKS
jgi:hypothetical protein